MDGNEGGIGVITVRLFRADVTTRILSSHREQALCFTGVRKIVDENHSLGAPKLGNVTACVTPWPASRTEGNGTARGSRIEA